MILAVHLAALVFFGWLAVLWIVSERSDRAHINRIQRFIDRLCKDLDNQ